MRRLVVMLVAALAVFVLAGCGGGSSTPPTTVTVTAPPSSEPSTSTAAPAKQVAIPSDLVGQNGAIAYDQLQQLGFSNVQLASRDAGSKVVLNLSAATASSPVAAI